MDITLGLDFGTHQSKLCLSYMPNNETVYEFFEFDTPEGTKSLLFPSVLQINDDDTVSVGYVDISRCKGVTSPKPIQPEYPEEPSFIIRSEPKRKIIPKPAQEKSRKSIDWKEMLASAFKQVKKVDPMEEWKAAQDIEDERWAKAHSEWEEEKNTTIQKHDLWQEQVNALKDIYEFQCSEWESHNKNRQNYRYFKLASFSASYKWDNNNIIDCDTVSVWYLTYIMLLVKRDITKRFNSEFEEDVLIQMGMPSSLNSRMSSQLKRKGQCLLIAARELMDHFTSPEDFCSTRYQDLCDMTHFPESKVNEIAKSYGFELIPEAFAGLQSLTNKGRLSRGNMHLLVDIGGGTTDVAFFTIREELTPNIHSVKSFHKGLNYVFEDFCEKNPSYSIVEAQELFFIDQSLFEDSIEKYKILLRKEIGEMLSHIIQEFKRGAEVLGLRTENLWDAMKGRPIVYCGGGSMYEQMRISDQYFSEIRLVDKYVLSIPNLQNEDIDASLFTILATSYGLSIPLPIDENTGDTIDISNTDINVLFSEVAMIVKEGRDKKKVHEYDLLDD